MYPQSITAAVFLAVIPLTAVVQSKGAVKDNSKLDPPSTQSVLFRPLWFKNSRYKDGTTKACAFEFLAVPYRALQCDRCLVITT